MDNVINLKEEQEAAQAALDAIEQELTSIAPSITPAGDGSLDLKSTVRPQVEVRRTTYSRVVKPAGDRLVAFVGLLVVWPIMGAVALAVAIRMGRPIFFRQARVGLGGKEFDVLKFRTMDHCRRDLPHWAWDGLDRRLTHKSNDDPRMNRLGQFLRTWSLDELPQLFNVLKGDMSLVGPRPELVSVVEAKYTPEMHARHAVTPGITGLWQVSARGDGLMFENPAADLEYAETQSMWLDFKILLRTPLAAFGSQKGQ